VTVHHAIFVDREISEQLFSECGVLLKNEGRFGTYDITADDPRWPCVSVALSTYRAVVEALRGSPVVDPNLGDRVWTEFTDDERNQAPFLEMMPSWLHGYPQPESVHGYMDQTYDLSSACKICHVGAKQKAPFRMKKSPVWGRRSILQMNWVDDEIFVKPDVYSAVFRPFGIGSWPVLLHKTGVELDTVVQLSIETIADVRVDGTLLEHVCSRCGRQSSQRSCRGFPPGPVHAEAPIFKSSQCFHGSDRSVFVSNCLYQEIVGAKLKGAGFHPCLENPN
jgi:hypothetical protein